MNEPSSPTTHLSKQRRQHAGIGLAYLLIILLATWPLVSQLTTHLYGGRDDLWVHQWTFWWVKQALAVGKSPFFTNLLYAPNGAALYSHNFAWFNIALWLPLQAVVGSTAAYNLSMLLILTLNGFCLYLLACDFLHHRWAAFIAGLIFMLWPYTLSHYDHPNMIILFWTPLSMLFLRRVLAHGRTRHIILAGVCLGLLGISRWQHLVMAFPLLASFVLWQWWQTGHTRRGIGHLALAGGIGLLLMLPLALPVFYNQLTRSYPEDMGLFEPDNGRTDLSAYLTPSPQQTLWPATITARFATVAASRDYVPYIGVITLTLALLGVAAQWRKTWFWLLIALVYMALALGPELAVNGRLYPHLPLPYRLIHDTALGDFIRRPHRLNLYLGIPTAMLAAYGIYWLAQRPFLTRHPILRHAAPLLLTALILLDTAVSPFPTTQPTIPVWHAQLAAEPDDFALWELPMQNRGADKYYMLYQTSHGQPLVGGHISRMPREAFDFIQQIPLLAYAFAQDSRADFALTAVTDQTRQLAAANIRYLVIHKQFANEGLQAMWRDWLTYNPTYEDDELIVYRTDPQAGVDFTISQPITPEIGLIRTTYAPQTAVQNGLIKLDARWGTTAVPPTNLSACLSLPPHPPACTPLPPLQAHDVLRGSYQLPIGSTPPGAYQLTLTLQDEHGQPVGEPIPLGPITVQSGQPAQPLTRHWNNGLQLNGYTLHQQTDALNLETFWQTDTLQPHSYKLFVHLINPADGQIVAQSDAIPRNWSYPTNAWEPGEQVLDAITLPLTNLPDGRYELWLGWYDEVTGERPLHNNAERLQLTTLTIP